MVRSGPIMLAFATFCFIWSTDAIRKFLKDKTKHEYSTNFRSKAGTKTQDQSAVESNAELITIIHKLIDYGIYVSYRI